MTSKKIFILIGHPDAGDTLTKTLATKYADAAKQAGHDIHTMHLGELQFDPILHKGYKVIQPLEPDLKRFEEEMRWCDHLVIIYPVWWDSIPALLKGLFDRAWLPGFEFHFKKHPDGSQSRMWIKLMKGKTARIIACSGTPPMLLHLFFGNYTNEIRRGLLGFAGFKTRLTCFGPSENLSSDRLDQWVQKVTVLGSRAR